MILFLSVWTNAFSKVILKTLEMSLLLRDYPFSMYAKFSEKLKFRSCPCAYQGVRIVNFSENFTYVING